jgi:hypothetical protein
LRLALRNIKSFKADIVALTTQVRVFGIPVLQQDVAGVAGMKYTSRGLRL